MKKNKKQKMKKKKEEEEDEGTRLKTTGFHRWQTWTRYDLITLIPYTWPDISSLDQLDSHHAKSTILVKGLVSIIISNESDVEIMHMDRL